MGAPNLEEQIETSVRLESEKLGYSEEMTQTAVDLALTLHRGGWRKIWKKESPQ